MRTTADAVRSVKRYVAEVLAAPAPALAEAFWLDGVLELRWSPGLVAGSVRASQPEWEALLALPRWAGTVRRLTPEGVAYRAARLAQDPAGLVQGSEVIAASTLPPPPEWEVRLEHDRSEFEYPFAVVKAAGPTLTAGGTARWMELTQPMTIIAYPTPPDEATGDAGPSQLAAERVRDLLIDGLRAGVGLARPLRLPLYDYDGLDLNGGSGQRQPNDFMRVQDASVNVLPEPTEPRQVAVVCDLRVNWRRSAWDDRGHRIVEEVRVRQALA